MLFSRRINLKPMTPRTKQSRALGYAILFFALTCVYAVLAYKLFSNDEVKFGIAMIALMLWMTGTGAFCTHSLLAHRKAEQKTKQEEKKNAH